MNLPTLGLLVGLALATPKSQESPEGGAGLAAIPRLESATETPLYEFALPAGPASPARTELGAKLFYDARLSSDGTVDCDVCHLTYQGFADMYPSRGVHGQRIHRNAPTLFNAMFNDSQFWDGRAQTLEEQARGPLLNPLEMGNRSEADLVTRLGAIADYREAFPRVFGRPIAFDDIVTALTAFERKQIGLDSPFDRFVAGDTHAIGAAEKRGWELFNGRGRCISCHAYSPANPFFTDQKFHNLGIAAQHRDFPALAARAQPLIGNASREALDELALGGGDISELGRFLVTGRRADLGAFKTPTLRNVAITPPYMHDGSLATLWDVLDHYNKGGTPNPFLDGGMQRLGLSDAEIDDLVAFLVSLTSDRFAAHERQRFPTQRQLSKTSRPQRDSEAAFGRRGDEGDALPAPRDRSPATLGVF